MVDGTWGGTMCLTEAHCGTDLGMLRTKAVPHADGSYLVTGSKIFISSGDHDLTENIVHLVLARTARRAEGHQGHHRCSSCRSSCRATMAAPAQRNGVSTCAGIEHKMGMKASATCQINFEEAKGWLVGAPNKGMQGDVLDDELRAPVGRHPGPRRRRGRLPERRRLREGAALQGRSLSGVKAPDKAADPIIVHPDVRRNLMRMRAEIEGMPRAVGLGRARARPQPTRRTIPLRGRRRTTSAR